MRIDEIEVVNLCFEYPPGQGFTMFGPAPAPATPYAAAWPHARPAEVAPG